MIEIKNLTKIYRTNKYDEVVALNDINLTLPNNGLVFVLGKSGSGKSTLLNVLGMLDEITSGDILFDGVSISKLKEDLYRNEYVGFIFQDYSLIENLTVKENIELSLLLKGEEDNGRVSEVLKLIDLEGFENRKISTLSAGQKQRVAIARGYIKKPKILLCDEPTGNLDSVTSSQILDLLKTLSKDTLVVVVSHNRDDATEYADRVIEIKDGKIFKDTEKSKKVSKSQTSKSLENARFSFKNQAKLALKFQNRRIFSTIIVSLFSSLITVLFCLCQFFTSFDKDAVIEQAITYNDQKVFSMKKAYSREGSDEIDTSKLISLSQEDEDKINESGYKGGLYKLYNYSMPISLRSWTLQNEMTINDSTNLGELYLNEIYGVAIIDDSYLTDVFYSTDVKWIASEQRDYGILITDYIADSILYYRSSLYSTYEDILGTYRNNSDSIYCYINGIIDTGYMNRYQSLFDEYKNTSSDNLDEFYLTDDYMNFVEDVKNYLGVAYSLDENFLNVSTSPNARNFVRIDNTKISGSYLGNDVEKYLGSAYGHIDYVYSDVTKLNSLPNNTVGVSLKIINELFNRNLSSSEIALINGKTITLTKYRAHNVDNTPVFTKEVKVQIFDTGYFSFIFSEDLFEYLRHYDIIPYSYSFTNMSDASKAYYALESVPFIPNSLYIDAGIEINNVVIVFNDFFVLVSSILLLAILLILCFNTNGSINSSKYEIGIFKALGMKNKDITTIFVLQILLSTLLTIILFSIGIFIFKDITNNILFTSFMTYLKNPALKMIEILSFNPWIFILDVILLVGINAITTLIPFIRMRKMKPLNILKRAK